MHRPQPARLRLVVDVLVSVAVALFLASMVEDATGVSPPLTLFGVVVGVLQGVALWWRRTRPVTVMAISLVGGLVIQWLAPTGVFPFAALIALGSLTAVRPPRVSVPALVALLGLTSLNFFTGTTEDAAFALLVGIVPWALGEAARSRRTAIVEESRRAVSEEQARIARDLHDVLAHSVSVIVVQAAAADDVFDERPDQARAALRSIERSGRDALDELRRVLVTVRPGNGPAYAQPGVHRLDELAEPLRAAGLDVRVTHDGPPLPGPLSRDVDVSAYRIVQEALTNSLRHSGAARVDVVVRAEGGVLVLEVRDDGRGASWAVHPSPPTGGRGIAGMRERAVLLGGTLEVGPQPEGGFQVRAQLPLQVTP